MGHLSPGEIFENILQLKRFGLYFKGILNRKWLLSYRNNDISTEMLGGSGTCSPQKIEMIDAILLVLRYYFDQRYSLLN